MLVAAAGQAQRIAMLFLRH